MLIHLAFLSFRTYVLNDFVYKCCIEVLLCLLSINDDDDDHHID